MPSIKTNAILPKGDENGLTPISAELVAEGMHAEPRRLRAVLGIIDCKRVAVEADTAEEVATVRFLRVEVLLSADLGEAEKLIRRALEFRSGQTTLPLDLEDEITQAFRDMQDPTSPEDPDERPPGTEGKGEAK